MTTKGSLALLTASLGILFVVLPAGAEKPATGAVNIHTSADQIEFRIGDHLVGRYHIGPAVAKPYFWPLNAPNGKPVTRGWPMADAAPEDEKDHIHQKSAWFCHGDIIPEGIKLVKLIKIVEGVDFWSETPGHGKIVCVKVGEKTQAKDHGSIVTHNEWRANDGQKILDEVRTLHLYNLGDAQLLVLDIDLHASVVPLTFGDTKEGSMGVRVRGSVTEKKGNGKITNAEGKETEKNAWGLESAWCDYSGPVEGTTAGIAVLVDPSNPHPTYWHSRGYGLMAANPFGRAKSGFPGAKGKTELVKLAKGEHLKLRYGLLLHMGDAKEGKVAEHYAQFVKLKK
jgi:hypothetical protein